SVIAGDLPLYDYAPPATQVALQTGFDFSDPSCAWTFTSPGDSLATGTYARLTSPWFALADRNASAFLAMSGKFPTNTHEPYLKLVVRAKDAGETRPAFVAGSANIYNSGNYGSDIASPHIDAFVVDYAFLGEDFLPTVGPWGPKDSLQFVVQIEDRFDPLLGTR